MDKDILSSNLSDNEKAVWWQYRQRDREKVRRLKLTRSMDRILWYQKFRGIQGQIEAEAATRAWLAHPITPNERRNP